jgi:hypothetical protein
MKFKFKNSLIHHFEIETVPIFFDMNRFSEETLELILFDNIRKKTYRIDEIDKTNPFVFKTVLTNNDIKENFYPFYDDYEKNKKILGEAEKNDLTKWDILVIIPLTNTKNVSKEKYKQILELELLEKNSVLNIIKKNKFSKSLNEAIIEKISRHEYNNKLLKSFLVHTIIEIFVARAQNILMDDKWKSEIINKFTILNYFLIINKKGDDACFFKCVKNTKMTLNDFLCLKEGFEYMNHINNFKELRLSKNFSRDLEILKLKREGLKYKEIKKTLNKNNKIIGYSHIDMPKIKNRIKKKVI